MNKENNIVNVGIQNQAIISVDTYYEMRKSIEDLKTRAIQLEKGEILRLQETIKELKIGLIMVLTKGRGGLELEPPYEVTTEGQQLIVTIKSNTIVTEKFNDVKVKIR
jgi:hypothetical protein